MTIRSQFWTLTRAKITAVVIALGAALVPPAAQAGPLTDAASDIEAMIAQGQTEDAVAAARDLFRAVTNLTGFGVTNAQLIEGPATGFGIYEPRGDSVYEPGEPIYAYVEVYGFSLTPQENGFNQLLFDVTFTLDAPDGEQMTDAMVSMGDIRLESYGEPVDGYFHLTYRVTGAEGAFVLRTSVTDRESGQTAEFSLPVIFEPVPAAAMQMDEK